MHKNGLSTKGKRTNSLAFCQTDCHTCASNGQVCDRRRPQCSTCLSQGRTCGGFATPLCWDSKRIWINNMAANDPPADRAPATTARVNATRARANSDKSNTTATAASSAKCSSSRRIRFVPGGLRGRKRRRACRPQNEQRVYSQATAGEDPPALSNEVVMPAGTDGDSVFPNTQRASNVPDDWGMNFPLPNQ